MNERATEERCSLQIAEMMWRRKHALIGSGCGLSKQKGGGNIFGYGNYVQLVKKKKERSLIYRIGIKKEEEINKGREGGKWHIRDVKFDIYADHRRPCCILVGHSEIPLYYEYVDLYGTEKWLPRIVFQPTKTTSSISNSLIQPLSPSVRLSEFLGILSSSFLHALLLCYCPLLSLTEPHSTVGQCRQLENSKS